MFLKYTNYIVCYIVAFHVGISLFSDTRASSAIFWFNSTLIDNFNVPLHQLMYFCCQVCDKNTLEIIEYQMIQIAHIILFHCEIWPQGNNNSIHTSSNKTVIIVVTCILAAAVVILLLLLLLLLLLFMCDISWGDWLTLSWKKNNILHYTDSIRQSIMPCLTLCPYCM